jgi:hypothetical protein
LFVIMIGPEGIRFVHADELAELLAGQGPRKTKRASHVEPAGEAWQADMSPVGGPVLGPFPSRREALAAEFRYLVEHDIPEPQG